MSAPRRRPVASAAAAVLLLAVAPAARANRNKQIASASEHCTLHCQNGGYCSFIKYFDYPRKGDVGYYQGCACRPGYTGGSCEKVAAQCVPPLYQCSNGAPCEYDADGKLGCDCSAAEAASELAGHMCRKPALVECDTLDESNKSFCTNGGVCLSSTTAQSKNLMFSEPTVHRGCQCASDAFEGPHCEFLRQMPTSSLAESSTRSSSKTGISVALFFLAALLTAGLVVRRWRRQKLRTQLEQSSKKGEFLRPFYQDNVAGDSNVAEDDVEDNELSELEGDEVGDLQPRVEREATETEPEVV